MNIDELFEQMQKDELEDQATTQTHMRISEYAKARSVAPQMVHYYIRKGRIQKSRCACGNFVIEIAVADEVFRKNQATTELEARHAETEEGSD
jgi:hypothetical protein